MGTIPLSGNCTDSSIISGNSDKLGCKASFDLSTGWSEQAYTKKNKANGINNLKSRIF